MRFKWLLLLVFFGLLSVSPLKIWAQDTTGEVNSSALNFYMEGMRLEMVGEYDSAAKAYLNALKTDSSSATIYFALARTQLRIGEVEKGENSLKKVVQLDSTNTDALKMLAEIARAKSQPSEAIKYLQLILRQDRENQFALGDLAESYHALGDSLKEAEILERIYEINPKAIQALGRAEQIYLDSKHFEKALHLYRNLLKMMPNNSELIERQLRLLVALERIPQADAFIDSVVATHPHKGEFVNLKGKYLSNVRGKAAAIAYLESIAADPKVDFQPRLLLAQLYFENQEFAKAVPLLQQILEKNPTLPSALSFLALSYLNLEQPEQAYHLLGNYIAAFPDDFFLHYLLGSVAQDLGTRSNNNNLLQEALGELKTALKLKPDDKQTLHVLAVTADQLHKTEQAKAAYQKIINRYPDDDLAQNNFAYMISEMNTNVDSLLYAAELVQAALRAKPDNPSYLDTAGWIYFKLGHLHAAREMLEKSLAIDSQNTEVLAHMANVLDALGQKEAAERYRQEAKKLD